MGIMNQQNKSPTKILVGDFTNLFSLTFWGNSASMWLHHCFLPLPNYAFNLKAMFPFHYHSLSIPS